MSNEQTENLRVTEDLTQPYQRIIVEAMNLHMRKAHDYGTGEDPYANIRASWQCGVPPWVGVLIRMNDKMIRLMSIAKKGYAANESARDSGLDLINYAAFMVMLLDEVAQQEQHARMSVHPHYGYNDEEYQHILRNVEVVDKPDFPNNTV